MYSFNVLDGLWLLQIPVCSTTHSPSLVHAYVYTHRVSIEELCSTEITKTVLLCLMYIGVKYGNCD